MSRSNDPRTGVNSSRPSPSPSPSPCPSAVAVDVAVDVDVDVAVAVAIADPRRERANVSPPGRPRTMWYGRGWCRRVGVQSCRIGTWPRGAAWQLIG